MGPRHGMPTGSSDVFVLMASRVSIAPFGLAPLVPILAFVQTRVFVITKRVNANVFQAGAAVMAAATWDQITIAAAD